MKVIISRSLLIVALVLGVIMVWMIRDMVSEVPFEKRYSIGEVECLAGILRADTYGESVAKRGIAMDLVADAAMRYRESTQDPTLETDTRVSYCTILSSGITLYPEKWSYPLTYRGRSLKAIKYSKRYANSSWDDALKHAIEALKRGLDRSRCAVKYTRAYRAYESFTNEDEAAATLPQTMKRDLAVPGVVGEFFCPAS